MSNKGYTKAGEVHGGTVLLLVVPWNWNLKPDGDPIWWNFRVLLIQLHDFNTQGPCRVRALAKRKDGDSGVREMTRGGTPP